MSADPDLQLQNADGRRVLLAGATGLVGRQILASLLADESVGAVHVLGRRSPAVIHAKLTVHRVDFAQLPTLPHVEEAYLALGTTIRVAGSQQAFRAVDFEANLAVAQASVAAGARRVALVSALGADAQSRVFYSRVKGELEVALRRLSLDALVIAQPSLLLGDRVALNQPTRTGEKIGAWLSRVLGPVIPAKYRAIDAGAVARALVATLPTARGTIILSSAELARIGGSMSSQD
jgi:uncharacterized protein YbjT (DUF2867 family)